MLTAAKFWTNATWDVQLTLWPMAGRVQDFAPIALPFAGPQPTHPLPTGLLLREPQASVVLLIVVGLEAMVDGLF